MTFFTMKKLEFGFDILNPFCEVDSLIYICSKIACDSPPSILFLIFDEKGRCLDAGKVYDPEQKICRDDCLTWDDKLGCIPITLEN